MRPGVQHIAITVLPALLLPALASTRPAAPPARIVASGFSASLRGQERLSPATPSVADLTAAAILAPIAKPPGSIWAELGDYPEPVEMLILEQRGTPAYRWVHEMYRRHRGNSAEIR
jgi:hypothetical protein